MILKRFQILAIALLLSVSTFAQDVKSLLENYPQIVSIEETDSSDKYEKCYTLLISQPLDHNNPNKGKFDLRVFLSHRGLDKSTVIVTEGYKADYGARVGYENELTKILNSNQVVIEHRFFSKSMPTPITWENLTVENAAADQHLVIEIIKEIYSKGKTITTGISKGGMTALYHRTLYPDDVDITVPYVAPVNFAVADKRHSKFIETKLATAKDRKRVKVFQTEALKRRSTLMPLFKEYCKKKDLKFRLDIDAIYDYTVLEYSFAFWQWGNSTDKIPNSDSSDKEIFDHLMGTNDPSYFAIEQDLNGIGSFFVQANRELGYYAYNLKPFKKYLTITNADNYVKEIFLTEENTFSYSDKQSRATEEYIQNRADHVMLIYGEWDPWSASAVDKGNNKGVIKYVDPEGSHKARINTLPEEMKNEAISILKGWIAE